MIILQISVLLVAITFMFVNMVSVYVNVKMLKKIEPFVDKSMKAFDKMVDDVIEDLDN